MSTPRLEIDLGKISHNARTLVDMLASRGISVMGITKATLGCPEIASAMLDAGVTSLGDSRVENIDVMRRAEVSGKMALIRSPMLGQVDRVVALADASFNTELKVLGALSAAATAAGKLHGVILMVELGDLREGVLPADLEDLVRETLRLPGLTLLGIGANLACQSGVAPDVRNMAILSELADSIDATFGLVLATVSGGNSANLSWALSGADPGRVNQLRLGESILLGRETLHRQPIEGLHTDAITLVAEVIESKLKPSLPWGEIGQAAFGGQPAAVDQGEVARTLLALGRQDIDPDGLQPPSGIQVLGASSDHLIVVAHGRVLSVGEEVEFQLDYSALVRAMTSPFIAKVLQGRVESDRLGRVGP